MQERERQREIEVLIFLGNFPFHNVLMTSLLLLRSLALNYVLSLLWTLVVDTFLSIFCLLLSLRVGVLLEVIIYISKSLFENLCPFSVDFNGVIFIVITWIYFYCSLLCFLYLKILICHLIPFPSYCAEHF